MPPLPHGGIFNVNELWRKKNDHPYRARLIGRTRNSNDAYWGIHTLRAAENFKISKQKISDIPEFVRGMVMVKKATARANAELGVLSAEVAAAIDAACDEVLVKGRCLDQFPSDVFQGGAGYIGEHEYQTKSWPIWLWNTWAKPKAATTSSTLWIM